MRSYKLISIGKLFVARACLEGTRGKIMLRLLVDTGSTYTIIPVEALEAIGISPAESKDHVRIITGSGILMAPRVTIPLFHCLGKEFGRFPIVGHTLPTGSPIDGLLGMDLLGSLEARINLQNGSIEYS